jgi:uncharacterized Zn finger protein (UPF0148 family)
MSEFDKEKEREKLREKYERDQKKREATQRMSELLLKGATMTNRHCDVCGDPIFRYEGQEFCPTCDAGGGAAAESETAGDATGESGEAAEAAGEPTTPESSQASADGQTAASQPPATGTAAAPTADAVSEREPEQPPTTPEPPARAEQPARTRPSAGGRGEGDLDAARASIRRTLTRHAEAAERAEDPRRARDHLAVVREAAEALAALDQ